MSVRKALLIQDISELMYLLRPGFEKAIETFMYDDVEPYEAWKWIIEHELDLIFGMVSKYHDKDYQPYQMIHSYLDSMTTASLSQIVSRQIGVPLVNYDHTIEVDVRGRDLFIYYVPLWKTLPALRNHIKHLHHEQSTSEVIFGPPKRS